MHIKAVILYVSCYEKHFRTAIEYRLRLPVRKNLRQHQAPGIGAVVKAMARHVLQFSILVSIGMLYFFIRGWLCGKLKCKRISIFVYLEPQNSTVLPSLKIYFQRFTLIFLLVLCIIKVGKSLLSIFQKGGAKSC